MVPEVAVPVRVGETELLRRSVFDVPESDSLEIAIVGVAGIAELMVTTIELESEPKLKARSFIRVEILCEPSANADVTKTFAVPELTSLA